MTTRILLADDHDLMRAGLRALIRGYEGFEVVGEASNGHETLEQVEKLLPDILLLDIMLPGLNGLEVLLRVPQIRVETRVIMLSMNSAEEYVLQAMRSGAAGYLVKSDSPAEFEAALKAVARGNTYLSSTVSRHVISGYLERQAGDNRVVTSSYERLTPRQREVLQLIAEGKSTKEIAVTLQIGTKTVETFRSQLMHILDIHDVAGLIRYAINRGLVGIGN